MTKSYQNYHRKNMGIFAEVLQALETPLNNTEKDRVYSLAIISLLCLSVAATTLKFSISQGDSDNILFVDFHLFHLVSDLFWNGNITDAYWFSTLVGIESQRVGMFFFMPWTYPPHFNLVIAPLAFFPLFASYFVFIASSLACFIIVLKRISGGGYSLPLFLCFPALSVVISCGQNGFLTAMLFGLAVIGIRQGRTVAGVPLGLMVIKPHLAIALATFVIVSQRWGTAAVALLTVLVTSALSTLLLGGEIWAAFLNGLGEARAFLEAGYYPFFRMVSPFAALRTIDAPVPVALAVQVAVAAAALAAVCVAVQRSYPVSRTLGITALASLLISPYAYDYDLPIVAVGLGLLLPDVVRCGHRWERASLYTLMVLTGSFGLIQTFWQSLFLTSAVSRIEGQPFTAAGFALLAVAWLAWRSVGRAVAQDTQPGVISPPQRRPA